MRHRRRRRWQLIAVGTVAVAVAALAVTLVVGGDNSTTGTVTTAPRSVVTPDGVSLAAELTTSNRGGKLPLVVMPASWGQPGSIYLPISLVFAQHGYLVLAYTQRGFDNSTGAADFAGAHSQQDVSTVISWALSHTAADPGRIGLFGLSYGAGISLLAAARDPRVKAVAALSTWTDVADSLDPAHTPGTRALASLLDDGNASKRLDAGTQRLQQTLVRHPVDVGAAVRRLSPPRSPMSYVSQLNRNGTAIMLANGYEDSIFAPRQLVSFFDALTTPKRLQLAAGDHGGPELAALTGAPSQTVDDARAWLDHFVRGDRNGIQDEDPIQLQDVTSGNTHGLRRWPTVSKADTRLLGKPDSAGQTSIAGSSWTARLQAGTDSAATSGPVVFLASSAYRPPTAPVNGIDNTKAFVWQGPVSQAVTRVSGTPVARLDIGSSAGAATLYLYLYDVAPNGAGQLMSVEPYTALGLTKGELRPVTVPMEPISWTVPAGHHLTLVADSVDPRYQSLTPKGATITVASSKAHPAAIALPVAR